jgi:hypothetical protein
MRRIFQHNVRHLTDVTGQTVRCLAVLEEAQTFLGDRTLDDRNIFVRWVKEGRKYGLGSILVTQQPSSIATQIISQGDNFFVLHLLNEVDLQTLKRHNAYFSDEILGFIRSEPIPGNCFFWSAPSQPFVLPARVCNFESVCSAQAQPPTTPTNRKPDQARLTGLSSKLVIEALESSSKVWVFQVTSIFGRRETGMVAFSKDYLQEAVAEKISADPYFKGLKDGAQWLKNQLPREIEAVLTRNKSRSGYAVLAGVIRPVWVIAQDRVKLSAGKPLRSPVEVLERI